MKAAIYQAASDEVFGRLRRELSDVRQGQGLHLDLQPGARCWGSRRDMRR